MNSSERKTGFIGVIGPANAGKSTLVNSLVGKKVSIVSPKVQTTRQRVLGIRTDEESQIIYVDTPGYFGGNYKGEMSRFLNSEAKEGTEGVDAVIYVVDVLELARGGAQAVERALLPLKKSGQKNKPPVESGKEDRFSGITLMPDIVVLNKIDLVDKFALLPVIDQLQNFFKSGPEASDVVLPIFIPVSARAGDGLSELRAEILKRLTTGPLLFPDDIVMEQSDETFAGEIIREKIYLCLKQELPYGSGVVVRSWEDSPKFTTLHADIIVEKDSHKGIVLGKGGAMIEKIGSLARKELERLYGVQIVLKLFVRVEKDWTRSRAGLMKSGYLLSDRKNGLESNIESADFSNNSEGQ